MTDFEINTRNSMQTLADAATQANTRIAKLEGRVTNQERTIGAMSKKLVDLERRIAQQVADRGRGPTQE